MSNTVFNIHDAVLIATAFQSFLFVLLIFFAKRDHHISDFFLIGFFIAQTMLPIHLLINYGAEFRFVVLELSPNLFRAFDIAFWLEGPLLLWYTRALLYKDFRLTPFDSIYLLPAMFYMVYLSATFYSWDNVAKTKFIMEYNEWLAPSFFHALEATREVLFIIFGAMCLIEIRRAQRQITHRYSDIEQIDLGWLGFLVIVFVTLRSWVLIIVLIAFAKPDLGVEPFNTMGLTGNYLMFALMSALIFFSLTRSPIFAGKITKDSGGTAQSDLKVDPAITRRIEQHMLEQKPYLYNRLNLDELANQLSMHPRSLSTTIKQHFETNFYEFINSYRINEAKSLLSDPSQSDKTILEILDASGFNSKATFNAFFKKLVGTTPTEYRASMQDPDSRATQ
ncbi:MAG: AraC family transcriptional regulator [Gammaproteobacteria bacterium]|nr:AraC family transcriptional regulator [Gammaproteobacteria bacterium]